jgi:hypothetical protein
VREQPNWLPSGPKAIFFVESGEHTWLQVSQGIADALHKQGLLENNKVESISVKEAAAAILGGDESFLEIGLASKYVPTSNFCLRQILMRKQFQGESRFRPEPAWVEDIQGS